MATLLYLQNPLFLHNPTKPISSSPPKSQTHGTLQTQVQKRNSCGAIQNPKAMVALLGAGLALTLVGPASAAELPSLQLTEPANALSLPTWAVHVSSVVEWITAMTLVWQYGEQSGYESWKGLSWGMVPLLGGAFCACTWHFFYNSESLEVLVALQAALTVIGNWKLLARGFLIYDEVVESSVKSLMPACVELI